MKISTIIFPYTSGVETVDEITAVVEGTGLKPHPTIPVACCGQACAVHFMDTNTPPLTSAPESVSRVGGYFVSTKRKPA